MVHSPNFWSKKHFLENSALPRTTSYRFLAPCQNLEETNHTIPRKRPERRKDGQTLRATAGFPKNNINKLSGAVLTNALIFSILVVLVKIIFWDTSACLLRVISSGCSYFINSGYILELHCMWYSNPFPLNIKKPSVLCLLANISPFSLLLSLFSWISQKWPQCLEYAL